MSVVAMLSYQIEFVYMFWVRWELLDHKNDDWFEKYIPRIRVYDWTDIRDEA